MMDLVIKNAALITMDSERRVLHNAAVAMQNGRIMAVGGADTALLAAQKTIDAEGDILLPGLINCHSHAGHSLIGKLDADSTAHWWAMLVKVYENWSDENFWYTDARLNACATLRNGITTSVNVMGATPMGDCPDLAAAHAKGCAEAGSREVLGIGVPYAESYPKQYTRWQNGKLTPTSASIEDMLAGTRQSLQNLHNTQDGKIRVFVTPHQQLMEHQPGERSPYSLMRLTPFERELNARLRELAAEFHTQLYTDTYGGWIPTAFLDKENMLLGPDVLLGMEHVSATNFAEVEILRQTGTKVYYTGEGYYKRVPVSEMIACGIPVAFTTNGCAPRTTLDLLESARRVVMAEQLFHCGEPCVSPLKMLEAITIDAARCLGLQDEIGSIEVGKRADFALVNTRQPQLAPCIQPVDTLARFASGGDFTTVVVGGRPVLEQGRITTLNEADLLREAAELHEKMIRDCGLEHTIPLPLWGKTRMDYL